MIDYPEDKDPRKSFYTDSDGNTWMELDDDVYLDFKSGKIIRKW